MPNPRSALADAANKLEDEKLKKPASRFKVAIVSLAMVLASAPLHAAPVDYAITLSASSGSQFGVTAPVLVSGKFIVDSAVLANADGDYPGTGITNFYIVFGSQVFDQNTAFSPNIQGIRLKGNKIIGMAMNWEQTSSGLTGPYMQMADDGTWETGTTVLQPGADILRGLAGAQSFNRVFKLYDVDGDGAVDALTDGLLIIRYLFGLRGSSLVAGAVSQGATRSAAEIEAYLQSKM